jgi:long-chain acyl-CoA synthetase
MTPSLIEPWRRTVTSAPNAVALIDAATERRWTRAELANLGEAWRRENADAVRGQIVVFAEANGSEWWKIFLGLIAADATAVALDPGEPLEAQRAIAKSAGAAWLWRAGKLEPAAADTTRSAKPMKSMGRKKKSSSGAANGCIIKLTSGSTGLPRVLRFTDAQMLADGKQICASMDIRPDDVNLGAIPFGHSYGLGNLVLPLLTQGTAIVSGAPVLPQGLAAATARWRPTIFPAVPALLRGLVEADIEAKQLESLRTVISAGAPLGPEIARAFHQKFGRKVHSFYGSSETGGITYDRTGDAALAGRSVGKPLDGVRVRFGLGKRFWVESPAVVGRGSFRPADRGELNELGELVLLGRAGRMLKIAGRRLDPAEVERALRELPGIEDALVDVHAERADSLVAAIVSRQPPMAWRERLRERLAAWKIPRRLVVLREFPLTARGKTDTRRLRERLRAAPGNDTTAPLPR